jgi:hypothetical protein
MNASGGVGREPVESDSDDEMEAGPAPAGAKTIKTRRKAHQKPQVGRKKLFFGEGGGGHISFLSFRLLAPLSRPQTPVRREGRGMGRIETLS